MLPARWTYQSQAVDQARGHLDACRIFNLDPDPARTRLVLTCCGANNLAMVDGLGQPVWELPGHHFESLRVAELVPDIPGKEILLQSESYAGVRAMNQTMYEKGRQEGQRQLICGLIEDRFGPISEATRKSLERLSLEHLRRLGLQIGTAASVAELDLPTSNSEA